MRRVTCGADVSLEGQRSPPRAGRGTQLVDVRRARDIEPYGHAVWGASEVWDSYWVPDYSKKDVRTEARTNIAYAVDLVRGLDVYAVDLPSTGPSIERGLTF